MRARHKLPAAGATAACLADSGRAVAVAVARTSHACARRESEQTAPSASGFSFRAHMRPAATGPRLRLKPKLPNVASRSSARQEEIKWWGASNAECLVGKICVSRVYPYKRKKRCACCEKYSASNFDWRIAKADFVASSYIQPPGDGVLFSAT